MKKIKDLYSDSFDLKSLNEKLTFMPLIRALLAEHYSSFISSFLLFYLSNLTETSSFLQLLLNNFQLCSRDNRVSRYEHTISVKIVKSGLSLFFLSHFPFIFNLFSFFSFLVLRIRVKIHEKQEEKHGRIALYNVYNTCWPWGIHIVV